MRSFMPTCLHLFVTLYLAPVPAVFNENFSSAAQNKNCLVFLKYHSKDVNNVGFYKVHPHRKKMVILPDNNFEFLRKFCFKIWKNFSNFRVARFARLVRIYTHFSYLLFYVCR